MIQNSDIMVEISKKLRDYGKEQTYYEQINKLSKIEKESKKE